MRKELVRKGCAAVLALAITAGGMLVPVMAAVYTSSTPAASVLADKYTAYADEYLWLNIRSTSGLTTKQSSTKEIAFSVTNTRDGSFTFDEAVLEFEDKAGITYKGGVSAKTSLTKSGDAADIRFNVTISRFCDTGMKNFRIILKNDGETVYTSRYFSLSVTENIVPGDEDEHGGIYINTIDIFHAIEPASGFATGSGNIMQFQVYNGSSTALRSAQIKLTLPDGIAIDNGSTEKQLGTIKSGDTVSTNFKLIVENNVEDRNYIITAVVTGLDNNKEKVTFEKNFYVPVDGDGEPDDPNDVHTPILMVSSYSYGGGSVTAGSTFPLEISFLNTSKHKLYNIKVVVDGEGEFVPVGSSNAFYIQSVGAGETASHTLMLSASGEAKQDALPVSVSMTYENKDGDSFNADDKISVPVVQEMRLFVDTIVPPYETYVGMEATASVDFYNMGKNVISNLRATAEGNFDIYDSNSKYFGNIQSGDKDDYKFTVIPREVGAVEGTVIFTYEDMAGNEQRIEIPFSFEAAEMPEYDDPWAYEEPEPVKDAIPWGLVIGLVILVVLIIAAIIIRKILKKKKERALELEDAAFEIDEKEDMQVPYGSADDADAGDSQGGSDGAGEAAEAAEEVGSEQGEAEAEKAAANGTLEAVRSVEDKENE